MGGSIGTPIFGAILAAQLSSNLASAFAGLTAVDRRSARRAPRRRSSPIFRRRSTTRYIDAYTQALQPLFLVGAGVALVAFALSWLIPEVPLRKSVTSDGIGESFAVPEGRQLAARAGSQGGEPRQAREPPRGLRGARRARRRRPHARRDVDAASRRRARARLRRRSRRARRATIGSASRPSSAASASDGLITADESPERDALLALGAAAARRSLRCSPPAASRSRSCSTTGRRRPTPRSSA